jgi:hypothetical protein
MLTIVISSSHPQGYSAPNANSGRLPSLDQMLAGIAAERYALVQKDACEMLTFRHEPTNWPEFRFDRRPQGKSCCRVSPFADIRGSTAQTMALIQMPLHSEKMRRF